MSFLRKTMPTTLALLLWGCNALPFVADPSISAVEAGDYTLVMSACEAAPGNGMDICRVVEGQPVTQEWLLILPVDKNSIGGEVVVFYRGIERSFPVTNRVISVPWRELIGSDTWKTQHDGEALALASIRYKNGTGLEEQLLLRGIAKLVVVKPSYTRLPIDSNLQAWGSECKIQYSSAGRSAVSCR